MGSPPGGWGQSLGGSGGGGSFSGITGGTNTNALVIGSGGSLTTTGTGDILAPFSSRTFETKFMGPSPNDFGAFGDAKFCYDINVAAQPTPNITSSSTFTLTNSSLTNNVATYTFANTNGGTSPVITVGQTISVTGSNNANGAINCTNCPVLSATASQVTVALVHANVASAADTGSITTAGAGNVGCANFSASDVGKVIEIKGVGAAGALLSTTILSVQSPTQATLNTNATTNATLQKAWYGHDDTNALQSWATAISNGFPAGFTITGTPLFSHSGYLAGLYFTTKPVRIDNPLGNPGFTGNSGDGTPEPFSNNNAAASPAIWGNGPYRSAIIPLSTFNFQLPSTSANTAVFYSRNWNGATYWNFGVVCPDSSVQFNTTTNTGQVAGWMNDQDAHTAVVSIQVENCSNTTLTLPGFELVGGGVYNFRVEDSQFYSNNYNAVLFSANNQGGTVGMDGIHFRGVQVAGPTGAVGSSGNVILDGVGGAAQYKSVSFESCEFSSCDGAGNWNNSEFVIRVNAGVADEIQISNSRICNSGNANGFGVTLFGAQNVSLTNVDINTNQNNAAFSPVFVNTTGARVKVFGGAWGKGSAAALTNLGSIASGSRILIMGTTNNTGATAFAGTGATSGVWAGFETSANITGIGNYQGTTVAANQGTPAAAGNFAFSAGWGTTAAATAVAGFSQHARLTITASGTGQAANPTFTWTLPNALPSATVLCTAIQVGGTQAQGQFTQTTVSATAPVFTYSGTPGAGNTVIVDIVCGP